MTHLAYQTGVAGRPASAARLFSLALVIAGIVAMLLAT
jgi:hypothetical protein